MSDYLISQDDPRSERGDQLAAMRESYKYDVTYGFPVSASKGDPAPAGNLWQLRILKTQGRERANVVALKHRGRWNFVNDLPSLGPAKLLAMVREGDVGGLVDYFMPDPGDVSNPGELPTLQDYRDIFVKTRLPSVAGRFDSDEYFAEAMVAGLDPTRLVRMNGIPAKFPLNSGHLSAVPERNGESLETAMAAGRVYWIDHQVMSVLANGRHSQDPKYMYAPMVAFAVARSGGPLRPFAIQCGQDPAGRQIYTPADGNSWRIAKNCVLAAHNTYHEVLTHLGFTHLLSEAVWLAAVRNLASVHPVAVLLRRHFEGTMSINKLAVDVLIQPGRAVDYLIGSELKSTWSLLSAERGAFSFTGNYLPDRFATHGTDSLVSLPYYPYRDDGLLVWNAVQRWAGEFVTAYYPSDAAVRADLELQRWAAEVAAPDGGKVRDFGATPGRIEDRNDLVAILTMVIWTAGPQHAAVNFSQLDHSSFLPANPLAGYTPEPVGSGHTDADWLASLPPLDVAVQQYGVMTLLGSVHYTVLGDYGDDFRDSRVGAASRVFRDALSEVDNEITARNAGRRHPYEYLRPSLIPNSTNI